MSAPEGRYFDPPPEALLAISKIKDTREWREDLRTAQRLCGRVVNVAIWEEPHWAILAQPSTKLGDFIRLRNVCESFLPEVGLNCKFPLPSY